MKLEELVEVSPYKSSSNFFSIKSNFLEEELLNDYLIFIF